MAEWNASDNLTDHQTTRNAQRWWPESQIQKEKWKMLALLVKVCNRLWRTAESVEIHVLWVKAVAVLLTRSQVSR